MRVYSRNVLLLTSHVFPTQTKTRHQSHAFCQLFLCNILFFSKLFKKTSNFFLFHFVPPSTDRLVYFIDFNHDTKREIDFFIWTTMSISIFCLLFPKNKNPHPGKFKVNKIAARWPAKAVAQFYCFFIKKAVDSSLKCIYC